MIPQYIHLIYETPDVPSKYQRFHTSMVRWHPDWKIQIYGDRESRLVISEHMPEVLELYNSFPKDVQRTDLMRIVLVYIFGGFYMDLDMLSLKELDSLSNLQLVLGVEKVLGTKECISLRHQHEVRIANYMFGAVAKHQFWKYVLDEMGRRFMDRIETENDILNSTGPGLLTDVYHEYKHLFPDITLLENEGHVCRSLCNQVSCHFGAYAAHYHLGSWRWEPVGST